MSWNDERIERLKTLWAEGHSASYVAAMIGGGLTRNAVVGKIHRLGLAGRSQIKSSKRPKTKPKVERQAPPKPIKPNWASFGLPDPRREGEPGEALPPVKRVFDPAKLVKLVDLEADQCRWPVGDPQDSEAFGFCGEPRFPGQPYCAACCRVAFAPPRAAKPTDNRAQDAPQRLRVVAEGVDTGELAPAAPGASERDLEVAS